MKRIFQFSVSIILAACISVVSCKKERSCKNCINGNQPPIANAGTDQVITLPTDSILLDGNASHHPYGKISEWLWTKISGPASFTIIKPSDSTTKVKALVTGTYQFELKVTDALGLFSKDTIQVTVNPVLPVNLPPVTNAGANVSVNYDLKTCSINPSAITLNGANSVDPDGTIVSYLWTGPGVISNPNASTTQVSNLSLGNHEFVLKVTDSNGATDEDTVVVNVVNLMNRPFVQAQLIPIGTLSQSRWGVAVAAAGNKIVFAGGWIDNGNSTPSSARVDIYDIATASWTTAQLTEGRFGIGVAVLGNKIFFGGGGRQQDNGWGAWQYSGLGSSVVDIFDVANNSWSTAQLSSPRVPVGASAGNKVVFAGGYEWNPSPIVDIYDGVTNIWTTGTLSESRNISQVATSGNKIFLAGGLSKRIDIFDALAGTWSIDSLRIGRGEMGAISANNKIYWGGGYVISANPDLDYEGTNSVEIRDLATNTTSFECLSEPRFGISAVRKENKIIFFGGYNSARFDIYDLTTNSWSIGVLPQNLRWASIISYNNILYVAGGEINDVLSSQVWKLEF